ncbi:MAG TPA: right-handed parallel beta-helix repeat-containing protein, partial [Gammaproteobacteria bacterium]|nr:right-handed parallel beta-helix repeat-containing protein [Gammaproteobacteria bacterium]
AGLRSRGIRVSGEEGDHVRGVHVLRNRIRNAGWVGITTSYADDVLIDGNTVWGSKEEHGIYVANSADNPVITNNTVFLNPEAGIQINGDPELGGDGIITGALVAGNRIYLNGSAGSAALNLASVRDSVFMNNLIYDNQSQGIANWDDEGGEEYGCKNNLYINNTVIMPPGSRHVFSLRHGSTGNTVLNNVFLHLGGKDSLAVDRASIAGLRSDYNIVTRIEDTAGRLVTLESWQQQTGQDQHSFVATAAEVFKDAASHDYSLREGSPAIGRGVAVEVLDKDITGAVREGPRPDIGAYRYQPRVPAANR